MKLDFRGVLAPVLNECRAIVVLLVFWGGWERSEYLGSYLFGDLNVTKVFSFSLECPIP